jgi:hypothetical protein
MTDAYANKRGGSWQESPGWSQRYIVSTAEQVAMKWVIGGIETRRASALRALAGAYITGKPCLQRKQGATMRRFKSIAEIEATERYVKDQPMGLDNYSRLEGWYQLEKEELRCCARKPSGGLCQTPHKRGWVARVLEGHLTVIGHYCAKNKFDTDSTIMRDISFATNAIDAEELKARLAELLASRDQGLVEINAAMVELDAKRRELLALLEGVGRGNRRKLEELSRSDGAVAIEGRTPAVRDADGDIIEDGRVIAIPVGSVVGVRACNPTMISPVADELRTYRKILEEANEHSLTTGSKAIRQLNATLADYPRAISQATAVTNEIELFLMGDLTAACFLVADWKERIAVGRIAMARLGKSGDPKAWIQKIEATLRHRYNVSQIRIGVSQ